MRIQRVELVALAVVLLAPAMSRPTWAMESSFEVAGTYDAVVDGMTARLTLDSSGSAQYVVRWLSGVGSNNLGKLIVEGKWAKQDGSLTFTFPNQNGTGNVVYAVSSCLSYKSFGKTNCSPGLHVVSSDLPSTRTAELWKTEFLNP